MEKPSYRCYAKIICSETGVGMFGGDTCKFCRLGDMVCPALWIIIAGFWCRSDHDGGVVGETVSPGEFEKCKYKQSDKEHAFDMPQGGAGLDYEGQAFEF